MPVALLTGSVKGAARERILRGLADGTLPLVVGTHALFQERVEYHDLALAVIDEQHRFGVDQRLLHGRQGAGERRAGDDRDPDPAHAAADAMGRDGRSAA